MVMHRWMELWVSGSVKDEVTDLVVGVAQKQSKSIGARRARGALHLKTDRYVRACACAYAYACAVFLA